MMKTQEERKTKRRRLTATRTEKALEIEKERDIDLEFYAGRSQSCLFLERAGALWNRNAMSQEQCPHVWIMFRLSAASDLSATGFVSGPCPLEQRRKKDAHSFTHAITQ